jgi:hypothetical protein
VAAGALQLLHQALKGCFLFWMLVSYDQLLKGIATTAMFGATIK